MPPTMWPEIPEAVFVSGGHQLIKSDPVVLCARCGGSIRPVVEIGASSDCLYQSEDMAVPLNY